MFLASGAEVIALDPHTLAERARWTLGGVVGALAVPSTSARRSPST